MGSEGRAACVDARRRGGRPGALGVAVKFMPQEWLLLIGRPVPRDDSATDWDARNKIAW